MRLTKATSWPRATISATGTPVPPDLLECHPALHKLAASLDLSGSRAVQPLAHRLDRAGELLGRRGEEQA